MENSNICSHLEAVKTLKTAREHVCEACIKLGTNWVHLRTCQTCGVTLCCDSSPMQHMSHHCQAEKHPVVISSEPGKDGYIVIRMMKWLDIDFFKSSACKAMYFNS